MTEPMTPKYQRKATAKQAPMIVLMLIAWSSLFLWAIPELRGVFSPGVEDTYTEWVADMPLGFVLALAGLHLIAGILLIWSAGHFIEWYFARRG